MQHPEKWTRHVFYQAPTGDMFLRSRPDGVWQDPERVPTPVAPRQNSLLAAFYYDNSNNRTNSDILSLLYLDQEGRVVHDFAAYNYDDHKAGEWLNYKIASPTSSSTL
ncbi:hypothetical protein GGTG_14238 [Gaeumannomyces tritici R3-111a-1]|uniref:Uncharacterized protein n=1 Tax=Gaeumannomyces tritici (strain R3-111a-1) TaxID=644352 RepID=J3PL06_GAET3|nr:hypothetical protein GGTG_14238 [Gaeumannomyces tritici R3-111a-1]EJT68184.1 hypothetical protein GGTG_14238 [Gaeumannomyces tritici R3-111a-1]